MSSLTNVSSNQTKLKALQRTYSLGLQYINLYDHTGIIEIIYDLNRKTLNAINLLIDHERNLSFFKSDNYEQLVSRLKDQKFHIIYLERLI